MALNIPALVESLKDCPCGRKHEINISRVEIREGLLPETGKIIRETLGGKKLHAVFDENTLAASAGILEVLKDAGYEVSETR